MPTPAGPEECDQVLDSRRLITCAGRRIYSWHEYSMGRCSSSADPEQRTADCWADHSCRPCEAHHFLCQECRCYYSAVPQQVDCGGNESKGGQQRQSSHLHTCPSPPGRWRVRAHRRPAYQSPAQPRAPMGEAGARARAPCQPTVHAPAPLGILIVSMPGMRMLPHGGICRSGTL